ncbi:DUF1778 domain-containing protein [Crocosphaera sp. XPORK-15E]|uniref:type II toxin-antitoxin system TacA family antitoxin n=1 Tax=Crocosphaera sp. XPORK-15E TaxID=3110247 RepID=UPI002B1F3DF3|nr:DUF1778 domain-containing protein [Crocosphaera sp. XPORK-15E]MEA5534352.1 DUF1778 domain-containing protein [Crocosphaera sp. XPORK-15E]
MSNPLPNNVRVTARVPVSVKETLEKAADLTGATLNQFLVAAAVKEAQEVIKQQQVISLSSSDADKIFSLIENPPAPNDHLKEAIARHQAFFSETH